MKSILNLLMVVALATTILLGSSIAAYGQDGARCGAMTTKGTPCKNRVKEEGLKCHHHAGNGTINGSVAANDGTKIIHLCGAMTAKGLPCKRRVKLAGQKCFSHN